MSRLRRLVLQAFSSYQLNESHHIQKNERRSHSKKHVKNHNLCFLYFSRISKNDSRSKIQDLRIAVIVFSGILLIILQIVSFNLSIVDLDKIKRSMADDTNAFALNQVSFL